MSYTNNWPVPRRKLQMKAVFQMIMTRDRHFYRTFWAIFWPLVLQNIINLSVNVADNLMLGAYSEAALAGASSVNQLQFILQCLVGGVTGGLTVLGSQYWGQRRIEPIKKLSSIAFWVSVAFAALIFGACVVAPRSVVRIFIEDAEVIDEGLKYLAVLKYSYILFAVTNVLLGSLSCVETVRVSFWVSLMTLIVNVILNLMLIPAYGSAGAAWATLASRIVAMIYVLIYVAVADKKLSLRLRDLASFDKTLSIDFIKVSAPVVAISGMWGFSNALTAIILGHMEMSKAIVAANSAAYTLYNLFKAGSQGAANAAGIIMAKTVGAGEYGKVKEYSRTLQIIFIFIGLVAAFLLFITKDLVLSMYELSPEAMKFAHQFMLVLCVCTIGMSYQMPTITGIIRGGGDTRFGMYNDLVSIWCIVLPVSALAAYVFKWPPVAVVACLNSDQIFKCGAAAFRCNRYRWVKKLTRDDVA